MTETYANDSCMYTTNYHEFKSFDFDSVVIKINNKKVYNNFKLGMSFDKIQTSLAEFRPV